MGPTDFYDDIVEYYDLIYADWESSMKRHGVAISAMLGDPDPASTRVLDVSAGIGTQALPLAALGFDVVARDLSPASIRRLEREAEARRVSVDARVADMRRIGEGVAGPFDAIIAFDNSVPHLVDDSEIVGALKGLRELMAPTGQVLLSVRDYDSVDRSPTSFHRYGERVRAGRRYRLGQEWRWRSPTHYRTTMVVEEMVDGRWAEVVRADTEYYAVPVGRLLELMEDAGFAAGRVEDVPFFQPVLSGRIS